MKKTFAGLLALMLVLMLAACGGQGGPSSAAPGSEAVSQPAPALQPESQPASQPESTPLATVTIAGLKGPTTMGMVRMWQQAEAGESLHDYVFEMKGTADEVVPALVSGEIPVAAIPANLASVLYNNSEGKIKVAAINTLGVLYVLETGDTIHSVEDLRGKTIYSTGKGTTPEFAMNYILEQNGLTPGQDVTIEFKSESTEIAALMQAGGDAIAVLPQPYVTAVQAGNENARVALSLNDEWNKVGQGSAMVTGVLVANSAWLAENEAVFADLLSDYSASIAWVQANTAEAAQLVAQYGIVEKAPVAEKALPHCNITYVAGAEMKTLLSGYLEVLYAQNPDAVGGQMPDDAFYYGA